MTIVPSDRGYSSSSTVGKGTCLESKQVMMTFSKDPDRVWSEEGEKWRT